MNLKRINPTLCLLAFISSMHAGKYIQQLLPDNSLIKQIDRTESRSFLSILGFDSASRQACDNLERALEQKIEKIESIEKNGFRPDYYPTCYALEVYIWSEYGHNTFSPTIFAGSDNYALAQLEMKVVQEALKSFEEKYHEAQSNYEAAQIKIAHETRQKLLALFQQK